MHWRASGRKRTRAGWRRVRGNSPIWSNLCANPSNFPEQHSSEGTMNEEHVSGFIERLRRSWRRSLHRRRTLDELAACPPSELKRMAADVGVSGEELYRLARYCRWAFRTAAAAT